MDKVFEDLVKFRKSKGKDLRESSLKLYKRNFNKIIKLLKDDNYKFESLDLFKDYKLVFEKIKDLSLTAKKSIIVSIMVVLLEKEEYKELKTIYYNYKSGLEKELKIKYKEQHKTEKESKNWLSLQKLKKIVRRYKSDFIDLNKIIKENLKKKIKITIKGEEDENILKINKNQEKIIMYYLITQLYIGDSEFHPPRRNIYATFNIVSKDVYTTLENKKKLNLLIIENKKKKRFQFANYKTSSHYEEELIVNLSKKMNKVINDVMPYLLLYNNNEYNSKWYKTSYNIPLIRYVNNQEKATTNDMTKMIKNIFKFTGYNITVNSIRKIVITDFYKKVRTKEEKEKFALLCGHSYMTGENIYNKMCN